MSFEKIVGNKKLLKLPINSLILLLLIYTAQKSFLYASKVNFEQYLNSFNFIKCIVQISDFVQIL